MTFFSFSEVEVKFKKKLWSIWSIQTEKIVLLSLSSRYLSWLFPNLTDKGVDQLKFWTGKLLYHLDPVRNTARELSGIIISEVSIYVSNNGFIFVSII